MAIYIPMDAAGDPLAQCLADLCCDAVAPATTARPELRLDADLLLASGAVEGPFRRTKPVFSVSSLSPVPPFRPLAQAAEFLRTYALYRRGGNTRRYSARIAYGCAFLGLPF